MANYLVGYGLNRESVNISGYKGFASEDEMVDFLMFVNSTINNTDTYVGGIVFTNDFPDMGQVFPQQVAYKIRLSSFPRHPDKSRVFNPDTNWKTQFMFPPFQTIGPRVKGDRCGGAPGKLIQSSR